MKELIVLIVLLVSVAFVPIESFTWRIFLTAAIETFLLRCFDYSQKKVLLYFFILSLLFNWGFNTYIEQFYQYAAPYLAQFDLKYKLDYFACVALFKLVAVFFEVVVLSLMMGFTKGLCFLVFCINVLSVVVGLLLTRWLG